MLCGPSLCEFEGLSGVQARRVTRPPGRTLRSGRAYRAPEPHGEAVQVVLAVWRRLDLQQRLIKREQDVQRGGLQEERLDGDCRASVRLCKEHCRETRSSPASPNAALSALPMSPLSAPIVRSSVRALGRSKSVA